MDTDDKRIRTLNKYYTKDEIDTLRDMYEKRQPARDIAKAIGRSVSSVYAATSRYINSKDSDFQERKNVEEVDIDMLRAMAELGASPKAISSHFGISQKRMRCLMRKNGIQRDKWTHEQLQKAIMMRKNGFSDRNIAIELRKTKDEVRYTLKKYMSDYTTDKE